MTDSHEHDSPGRQDVQLDVLLDGAYFCDLVFGGLPEVPQIGRDLFSTSFDVVPGGAFYTAQVLHRFGLRSGWICDVGNDMFSRTIDEAARTEGIDTSLFRRHPYPLRRLAAVFSFTHDRGFISYADGDLPSTVPMAELLRFRPRCLMLASIAFWPDLHRLAELPRRFETIVYLDCQDSGLTLETPGLVDALGSVDVFAPNADEAVQLTGASSVGDALACLAEIVPTVVIKCGKDGAMGKRGNETVEVAPIPVKAVDTTGAGDCFNAGYVYGLLNGASLADCLRYGNIVGGLSTTGLGGGNTPKCAPALADFYYSA